MKRVAAFSVWLAIVSLLCRNHVVWRDEVRALSLALAGNGLIDMFRYVHADGHPALWHIGLRAAYVIFGSSVALKGLSIAAAAAAICVLLFRLTLPFPMALLVVFSGFPLYECGGLSSCSWLWAG